MSTISNNMDMSTAMSSASSQNIQMQQNLLQSIGNSKEPDEVKKAKLREASEGFEAIFIQQMWQQMRASLPKDGLISSSKDEQFWQSMYDEELSKSMASSGGIGLADMMVSQLDGTVSDTASASRNLQARSTGLEVPPAALTGNQQSPAIVQAPTNTIEKAEQDTIIQAQAAPIMNMSMYDEISTDDSQNVAVNNEENIINTSANTISQNIDNQIYEENISNTTLIAQPLFNPAVQSLNTADMQSKQDKLASMRHFNNNSMANAITSANSIHRTENMPVDANAPVVTRVVYQTNLPKSERQGQATVDQILNQAAMQAQQVNSPIAQNTQIYTDNTVNNLEEFTPRPVQSSNTPIITTANNMQNNDILAGITQTYVKTNQISTADFRTSVQSGNHQSRLQPTLAGGPDMKGPSIVTQTDELGLLSPEKGSMQNPVDGKMTSGFGWRLDPINGKRSWHNGVDIAAKEHSPVRAADEGVISFAGYDDELGNVLIIDHPNGLSTVYGHNAFLDKNVGDYVSKGTEIARVGSSGRTVGSHLHFEIRKEDMPINPEKVLDGYSSTNV